MTVSVAVLLTKEEYVRYRLARRPRYSWLTVVGFVTVVLAVLRLIFDFEDGVSFAIPLAVLGACFALVDAVFVPAQQRLAAAREYDEDGVLNRACTYGFSDSGLTVENARMSAQIPYTLLTTVYETDAMFVAECGAEVAAVIPKRALSEEEISAISNLMKRENG